MEGQLKNGAILTSESGNKYMVVNLLGADVIGRSTFLAPLSRHTCNVLAKSSTLISVPPILISPSTARLLIGGLLSAADEIAISVGSARFPVIPSPCIS